MNDLNEAKLIKLTQGQFATVDEDVFEFLNSFKWSCRFSGNLPYAYKGVTISPGCQKMIFLHHVIIGFPLNGLVVDHINGNGLDNRRENLRFVSMRGNSWNRWDRRAGKTSSRFVGVNRTKDGKPWQAKIYLNGKYVYLGSFLTEEKASEAYQAALSERGGAL